MFELDRLYLVVHQTCLNVPVYTLCCVRLYCPSQFCVFAVHFSVGYLSVRFVSETCFVYFTVHLYLTVFVWLTLCVGQKPVYCMLYTLEYRLTPVFSTPGSSQILRPCKLLWSAPHSGGLIGPSRRMRRMEWGCLLRPLCCFRLIQTPLSRDNILGVVHHPVWLYHCNDKSWLVCVSNFWICPPWQNVFVALYFVFILFKG